MSDSVASVHAPALARVATAAPLIPAETETTTELSDSSVAATMADTNSHSASASSLHEETDESSGEGTSNTESSESSSSFDWAEAHETATPTPTVTVTPTPTKAPVATKPAASAATSATTKSGSGSSTTIGISLALVGVILAMCVVFILRRRRQNRRLLRDKFNPNLEDPGLSIELPPPPPSSHLSASQLNQSRLSVFSGNRSGGDSLFNTAAPIVSPHGRIHQNGRVTSGVNGGAPFRPDQSMTYRLVDPSPSHTQPTSAASPGHSGNTFALTAASVGQSASPHQRPYQPDYGSPHTSARKTSNANRKISTATNVTSSTSSFSSESSSLVSLDYLTTSAMSARTSAASETSTVNGLHDSMCDDFYKYGDGIGRERAISRGRGASSASASASTRGPSTVLEIDELEPAPAPVLVKTPSAKTISITAMRGKRAPPPPPPPPRPLPEVEPFDPLLMTSVKVHKLRASEDDSGHVVVASAFADSSSETPLALSHLQSSHNGRIFEKPTDDAMQRLSDVSSVFSDSSSVRAGSLIELKQVVEVENAVGDGGAKEIEI